MNLEAAPNDQEKEMIIDDEKLSAMADESLEEHKKLKQDDPRVEMKRAVDRVVKRHHIPEKDRVACADMIHGRLVSRTAHRWKTEGVHKTTKITSVPKNPRTDWIDRLRDKGNDNY